MRACVSDDDGAASTDVPDAVVDVGAADESATTIKAAAAEKAAATKNRKTLWRNLLPKDGAPTVLLTGEYGAAVLEPVLEREHAALTTRDPAVLEAVVREEVGQLQRLQHSLQARDRLQQSAGYDAGNAGGTALVVGSVGMLWKRIRRLGLESGEET